MFFCLFVCFVIFPRPHLSYSITLYRPSIKNCREQRRMKKGLQISYKNQESHDGCFSGHWKNFYREVFKNRFWDFLVEESSCSVRGQYVLCSSLYTQDTNTVPGM